MHIAVFVKRVLDPELPATEFRVDSQAKDAYAPEAPYVMGPFDENALEVALMVKDKLPGTRVSAISYGPPPEAEAILRKALSTGVDDALLVIEEAGLHDVFHVARVLAAAARRAGSPDLLLFGLQSGDWDSGQTPFAVAEILGAASVSHVSLVEPEQDGSLRLHRVLEQSTEIVRLTAALVVASVTNDGRNALRKAKVKDVLMARGRPVEQLSALELGVSPVEMVAVSSVEAVARSSSSCAFMAGEDDGAKGRALVERLLS